MDGCTICCASLCGRNGRLICGLGNKIAPWEGVVSMSPLDNGERAGKKDHRVGIAHGNGGRARAVYWRDSSFTADMFLTIRNAAVEGEEYVGLNGQDESGAGGLPLLARVCDYEFIMSLKAPAGSTLSDPEKPEGQMMYYGFLPLGQSYDAELGCEALYVLVRHDQPPHPNPPHLSLKEWQRLKAIISQHIDHDVDVILLGSTSQLVSQAIDIFYYDSTAIEDSPEQGSESVKTLTINDHHSDPQQIRQARLWLRKAVDSRASDLHLEPGEEVGRLRLRIDGELVQFKDRLALKDIVRVITWVKAQAQMRISERRRPLDGSIRLNYRQAEATRRIDTRISTVPTIHGEKMVIRLLDPDTLRNLAAEGLDDTIWDHDLHAIFVKALASRDGIVLVTGPTGSGKTTTLNAALFHLLGQFGNRRNIVTLEDPVEYNVEGVNQIQINEQAGVTFASTLRSVLRQDPDVVLVGEIRDCDTAAVAIQAALTGHLILATLHTNDALGAVDRLRDLGVTPFLIGSTVRLFQAQRLVRLLCPTCGHARQWAPEEVKRKVLAGRLASYQERLIQPDVKMFEPRGCANCTRTGFYGRTAVMEMAPMTTDLVTAIENKAPAAELTAAARKGGYRPMVEGGLDLLLRGRTSLSEIEGIGLNV